MEVKGITAEQIRQAVDSVNERYDGQLKLKTNNVKVKLPEPIEHTESYTIPAAWRIKAQMVDGTVHTELGGYETEETAYAAASRRAMRFSAVDYASGYAGISWVEYVPEYVKTYTWTRAHEYKRMDIVELNKRGDRVRFTLKVKDVRNKPGARMGHERRINAACWHLNRDLYVEIFKLNPDARIKTALATYNGWQDFLDSYPETGEANIGSYYNPLYMSEACNCHEFETYDEDTILYRDVTDALDELEVS